jgi:hypothetical protein
VCPLGELGLTSPADYRVREAETAHFVAEILEQKTLAHAPREFEVEMDAIPARK